MLRSKEYTFKGIDRDTSKSKRDDGFYWELVNKRIILSEDSSENGNVVDEQGLGLILSLPEVFIENIGLGKEKQIRFVCPFTGQIVIKPILVKSFLVPDYVNTIYYNHTILNINSVGNKLVLFTLTTGLYDLGIIWIITYDEINDSYSLDINFLDTNDKMNWSVNNPISSLPNIETETIKKLYFIDGRNQMRYINTEVDNFDYDLNRINTLPFAPQSEVILNRFVSGGFYKAGVIQYCYNFYNINGSQTKISPISPIIYLGDNLSSNPKGLAVNEYSSSAVEIIIQDINTQFDRIKVFALYRTSINQSPEVRLIYDNYITSNSLTFVDSGQQSLDTLTVDELLYLGGEYIIPEDFDSKDGYLFFANYKFEQIRFPESLDLRCVQFDKSSKFKISNYNGELTTEYDNVSYISDIDISHDFINPDFYHEDGIYNPTNNLNGYYNGSFVEECKYRYQSDGITLGGEGKYIKYSFEFKPRECESRFFVNTSRQTPLTDLQINNESLASKIDAYEYLSVKTGEIYRIAIEARDEYGRITDAKWIADVKVPEMLEFYTAGDKSSNIFNNLFPDSSSSVKNSIQSIYIKLEFNFNDIVSEFALNGINIKSFRILRAQRTNDDKSIIGQGLLNSSIHLTELKDSRNVEAMFDYFQRYRVDHSSYTDPARGTSYNFGYINGYYYKPVQQYIHNYYLSNHTANTAFEVSNKAGNYVSMRTTYASLISPDFIKEKNVSNKDEVYSVYTLQLYSTITRNIAEKISNKDVSETTIALDSIQNSYGFNGEVTSTNGNFLGRYLGIIGANLVIDSVETGGSAYDTNNYYDAYMQSYTGYNYDDSGIGINESISNGYPAKMPIENIDWFNGIDSKVLDIKSGEWYRPKANIGFIDDSSYSVSYNNIGVPHIAFLFQRYNTAHEYALSNDVAGTYYPIDLGDSNNVLSFDPTSEGARIYGTLCEIRKKNQNQYGGFNFSQKTKSIYIPFSLNKELTEDGTINFNCTRGDTFVTIYRNLRHYPDYSNSKHHFFHEIVSFPVETYINLDLRNDNAFVRTEFFLNTFDDSYKMNDVYNQEDNIITNTGLFNFQSNDIFLNNIIPSKKKTIGELVDSWTDIQILEQYSIEGKYGKIEKIIKFNNEMFCFQDNAVSRLIINPRVAVTTSDGAPVELGAGIASGNPIIQQHIYIDIQSGCQNKFSIQNSDAGIVYLDLINKSLMLNAGGLSVNLSQELGMASYFNENIEYKYNSQYNQLIDNANGITSFYDTKRKEYYLTLFGYDTGKNSTIVYSFRSKTFTHNLTYFPSMYLSFYGKNFVIKPGQNKKWQLYQMWKSDNVCVFFHDDVSLSQLPHRSFITFLAAPEIQYDKLFTNAAFDMERYSFNGLDVANKSFDKIKIWNEYQESNEIDLVNGKNINRKYRTWKCQMPRMIPLNKYKGVRVGSNWAFIKFINNNYLNMAGYNDKTILHNMNIIYVI